MFVSSYSIANSVKDNSQKMSLALHIKNQLINSVNPGTWYKIKDILERHCGDTWDALIRCENLNASSENVFLNLFIESMVIIKILTVQNSIPVRILEALNTSLHFL